MAVASAISAKDGLQPIALCDGRNGADASSGSERGGQQSAQPESEMRVRQASELSNGRAVEHVCTGQTVGQAVAGSVSRT